MAASDVALNALCEVCGLLSDSTRLKTVLLLAQGDSNVTTLCEKLKTRQPLVSHHLGLLRMNRLIVGKRKGKSVVYSLASQVKVTGSKVHISLGRYSVTLEGA